MSRPEPTEEEMRAAMEEQLRRITVPDVLIQTVATLVNLAGRRLGLAPEAEDERDLEQARLAIEGTRALVPLVPAEEGAAVREALSQLQVAFARQAQAAESASGGESSGGPPAQDQPPPAGTPPGEREAPENAADRAKARSRIWTPPGT